MTQPIFVKRSCIIIDNPRFDYTAEIDPLEFAKDSLIKVNPVVQYFEKTKNEYYTLPIYISKYNIEISRSFPARFFISWGEPVKTMLLEAMETYNADIWKEVLSFLI